MIAAGVRSAEITISTISARVYSNMPTDREYIKYRSRLSDLLNFLNKNEIGLEEYCTIIMTHWKPFVQDQNWPYLYLNVLAGDKARTTFLKEKDSIVRRSGIMFGGERLDAIHFEKVIGFPCMDYLLGFWLEIDDPYEAERQILKPDGIVRDSKEAKAWHKFVRQGRRKELLNRHLDDLCDQASMNDVRDKIHCYADFAKRLRIKRKLPV